MVYEIAKYAAFVTTAHGGITVSGGEPLLQIRFLEALLRRCKEDLGLHGFFYVLLRAGWHPGDATAAGSPLHHCYLQATTITFAGIVSCQIGTAFAARADRASLFTIGLGSNRLLLGGIAFELVFTGAVIYVPPLQAVFGTAALDLMQLAVIAPFPVIVWGVDELVAGPAVAASGRARRPTVR